MPKQGVLDALPVGLSTCVFSRLFAVFEAVEWTSAGKQAHLNFSVFSFRLALQRSNSKRRPRRHLIAAQTRHSTTPPPFGHTPMSVTTTLVCSPMVTHTPVKCSTLSPAGRAALQRARSSKGGLSSRRRHLELSTLNASPQFMPLQLRANGCGQEPATKCARLVQTTQSLPSYSHTDVPVLLTVLLCLWCLLIGWFAHDVEPTGSQSAPIAEPDDWLDEMRFGIWRQVLRRV